MFLYFDKKGILQEIIDDLPARSGSAEKNKVYAFFEVEGIEAATFKSSAPSTVEAVVSSTTSIVFTDDESATGFYIGKRDLKYFKFYKPYAMYCHTMTQAELTAGKWQMTIRGISDIDEEEETSTILAMGNLVYNVEQSIVQKDESIGQNEYDYIISLVASKGDKSYIDEKLALKVDKTSIATAFGETLSDEKIPSEKLVKNSLDTKISADTTATTNKQVYTKNADGTQSMSDLDADVSNNGIVVRNANGGIKVPTTATNDSDAISKGEVATLTSGKQAEITDLQLPYGEHTATYDTTDGLAISGKAKVNTNGNVDLTYYVPIKAGDNISMDVDSDNKFLEVKATIPVATNTDLGGIKADLIGATTGYNEVKIGSNGKLYSLQIGQVSFLVVSELPETGQDGIIYLVPKTQSTTGDLYDEYVWVNSAWEHIGGLTIDLSNYYTKTQVDALLNAKQNTLVSGTNIKTINGSSILGSGDLSILTDIKINGVSVPNANIPLASSSVYGATKIDGTTITADANGVISAVQSLQVLITSPASATSGTLTQTQLDTLQASENNYIMFNNEKYYLNDKGHNAGYLGYSHIGYENSKMILKNITITISTLGWVLSTQSVPNISVSGTTLVIA